MESIALIDHKKASAILQQISSEMIALGIGQVQDIYSGTQLKRFSEKNIITLYTHKTGKYSFGLPITLGLILAGKKINQKLIDQCSYSFGKIYQLQDDYLNIFGNPSKTGKSSLTDIYEKKQTLLYFTLLKKISRMEYSKVNKIYNTKKNITSIDVEYITSLMLKYELPIWVNNTLEKEAAKIHSLLRDLPFNDYQKDQMSQLTSYLISREK